MNALLQMSMNTLGALLKISGGFSRVTKTESGERWNQLFENVFESERETGLVGCVVAFNGIAKSGLSESSSNAMNAFD